MPRFQILKEIGSGSFSQVFRCQDSKGRHCAAKRIKIDKNGLPSLFEVSIMTTIRHPHLTFAYDVEVTPVYLYIIQDLADMDLFKRSRKSISPDELKKWLYSLLQAVNCLHQQGIVHGDIKASNAFLYPNGNVKLGDFTLSTRTFVNRRMYTFTHRPPENWSKEKYDLSSDIWALGCTFFELAFGKYIFPYVQKTNLDVWYQKAIEEWHQKDYRHSNWERVVHTDSLLDDLILSMLKVDSKKRPTASELLKHPYFYNIPPLRYYLINKVAEPLPEQETNKIMKELAKLTFHDRSLFILQVFKIYSHLQDLNLSKKKKFYGSLHIAEKVLYRKTLREYPSWINSVERTICKHLEFRLH